ncbi:DUF6036 family nucleotidyltransferase [Phytoactinopolyspora limicola]|uniref:DUF6036 family nucleotidyltransferase n=1 Tax=Phytoactinopolyspora limicola TaxID=2715536 RepID=UPI001407B80F|nr:DUF6036 family nucleotidyltransferase [Phytoactinopolyspora limicola]
MRRDQLEHAIRTACQIIDQPEVIVAGSQAILATFDEEELPAEATMSIEVDILPIANTNTETAQLADLIEGVAGEFSSFQELHGFSIDGVDLDTSVLPDGWRERLVKVQNANTAAPAGRPRFTGWCVDKEDLCAAKLCAFREKDRNFVAALLEAGLVDRDLVVARLATVPNTHTSARERALSWLKPQQA